MRCSSFVGKSVHHQWFVGTASYSTQMHYAARDGVPGEVTGCKRVVPQTVPVLQKQGRASALFHGASAVPQKPNLLVRDAGDSFEPHPCGSAMRNRYHRVRRLPEFYHGLRPCSVMQFEYAYHGMALELYSFALWKPAVEHLRVAIARTASASVMLRLPRIG